MVGFQCLFTLLTNVLIVRCFGQKHQMPNALNVNIKRREPRENSGAPHLGEATLLVDERQDVERLAGDHVQGVLVVVVRDVRPGHALARVVLLLSLNTCRTKNCCSCSLAKLMHSCSKLHKDPTKTPRPPHKDPDKIKTSPGNRAFTVLAPGLVVVVVVVVVVGKPVLHKVLEAEDVQQTDALADFLAVLGQRFEHGAVDLVHHPDEQASVDGLPGTRTAQQHGDKRLI